MYSKEVIKNAEHFLSNEKQFHLGILPTEQSNPKTRNIDQIFTKNPADGVKMLLNIDRDVVEMAKRVQAGKELTQVVEAGFNTICSGGKIIFSGCGATGRLSILLESMWRRFFIDLKTAHPAIHDKVSRYENSVFSIMTGGDYALIRSVESFEDYAQFGKQQARELKIDSQDMLVAITEGGETSSVLGTVEYAADQGAKVFLMFNNPANILCQHIERSRRAIEDQRVTVLDLYCGPMAIAGSTRMQATTSEQLIAGAALEKILYRLLESKISSEEMTRINCRENDYVSEFEKILEQLSSPENTAEIARIIELETEIYRNNGLVTYYANHYLLDIFTDTTERAPTFMLPPFKRCDDADAPPSWAFVKDPQHPTSEAWKIVLGRSTRCLNWNKDLYMDLNAPRQVIDNPPRLSDNDIVKFLIGNDADPSRTSREPNAAIAVIGGSEQGMTEFNEAFDHAAKSFQQQYSLLIGNNDRQTDFIVYCTPARSLLKLTEHMAVKLVLNTLSTGTMIMLGRVTSNWMSWVEVSNKKLRDRGIRLIAELCNVSYREACYALHDTISEFDKTDFTGKERPSPVQYTIQKLMTNDT